MTENFTRKPSSMKALDRISHPRLIRYLILIFTSLAIFHFFPLGPPKLFASGSIEGCRIFPANNIWNVSIRDLPVDPRSRDYIETIGQNAIVHADFGSGMWNGGPIGIPFDGNRHLGT